MHLRADQPPLRDDPVEHGGPRLVVLRALNERRKRVAPAWVYDPITSLQLKNDAVVERSAAKNGRGHGANDYLSVSGGPVEADRSYLIPLTPGEALPRVPTGGFRSEEEVAQLPGARKIDALTAVPGSSPDVYAFYRGTTQRNLYRIPVQ